MEQGLSLADVWEDDMLSFIAFLIVILPVPFLYVFFDNTMFGRGSLFLTYYSFLGTAVFWMAVAVLYVVYNRVRSRGKDEVSSGRM